MIISLPKSTELSDYYKSYQKYITENDLLNALESQIQTSVVFLKSISDEKSAFAYEPNKWEIKEVVGHLCDTERILSYRALQFARKDTTPLAGFDENHFVQNANFRTRSWASLYQEKEIVGRSSLHFFNSLDEDTFDLKGTANNKIVSVRALLFFIIAHERHHLQVIKDRYLKI